MMTLPPSVQLYVATQPIDVRKSFSGLSLYVQTLSLIHISEPTRPY